jgi:hypothetical protein
MTVGGLAVATGGEAETVDRAQEDARVLGKKLVGAIRHGFSDPNQEEEITGNREFFKDIVVGNRDFRTDEYERWVKLGWID